MTVEKCDAHRNCSIVRTIERGTIAHLTADQLRVLFTELRIRVRALDRIAAQVERQAQAVTP